MLYTNNGVCLCVRVSLDVLDRPLKYFHLFTLRYLMGYNFPNLLKNDAPDAG